MAQASNAYSPLAESATEEQVPAPEIASRPWLVPSRVAGAEVADSPHDSEPAVFPALRTLPSSSWHAEADGLPRERLIPLQAWEGAVLEVDDSSFVARAVDVAGEHADEEVSLPKDELSDFDLDLLEPGAIFYWTIGYREKPGGARERVSQIRFRRLPAWSTPQLEQVEVRADALARNLGW